MACYHPLPCDTIAPPPPFPSLARSTISPPPLSLPPRFLLFAPNPVPPSSQTAVFIQLW